MTQFEPERIFAALAAEATDYVAVGGIAVIAHGVVRATVDVDIVPAAEAANLERLASAIIDLAGHPHAQPETEVTADLLARDANMRFDTAAGPLDVLCSELYRHMYAELRGRAITIDFDATEIVVVSRNDLIRLKAGSGRDRDLLDIGDLLALEE